MGTAVSVVSILGRRLRQLDHIARKQFGRVRGVLLFRLQCGNPFEQRRRSRFQQFLAAVDQVGVALPVNCPGEGVVGRPAVVNQSAGPIQIQQPFRRFPAPRRIDHVHHLVQSREFMQPCLLRLSLPLWFAERRRLPFSCMLCLLQGGHQLFNLIRQMINPLFEPLHRGFQFCIFRAKIPVFFNQSLILGVHDAEIPTR
jgi:hypothetical protein